MDPATWLTILGVGALAWLVLQRGRVSRQRDLPDVLSGLFGRPGELGWPIGVQEEDTIRPWGLSVSKGAGAAESGAAPGASGGLNEPSDSRANPQPAGEDDLPEAILEDGVVAPVEVARVHRAA